MEVNKTVIFANTYKRSNQNKALLLRDINGWLLMLPSLIIFTIFVWQPLISGLWMSFFRTKGFTAVEFIGVENYINVIKDPVFIQALLNTFQYTLWSIVIGFITPILVAIIINEVMHAQSFFKFAVFFPGVVPGVAVILMWAFLFEPGNAGVLNGLLSLLHIPPGQWLQDTNMTIPLIVLTLTWKGFGGTMLIYLSAIKSINNEMFEAATLDGAGVIGKLRFIMLPELFNTGRLLLILQIIAVFQIMYEPFVMTGGGPRNASMSLMLLNYNYAFKYFDAGKAMAVGGIVFVILLILTAVYNRVVQENER